MNIRIHTYRYIYIYIYRGEREREKREKREREHEDTIMLTVCQSRMVCLARLLHLSAPIEFAKRANVPWRFVLLCSKTVEREREREIGERKGGRRRRGSSSLVFSFAVLFQRCTFLSLSLSPSYLSLWFSLSLSLYVSPI